MLNVYEMPELPEVETIVRQLSNRIVGKVVRDVNISDSKVVDLGIKEKIITDKELKLIIEYYNLYL